MDGYCVLFLKSKINCDTGINDKRFITLITISKWTLIVLSIVTWFSELAVYIDVENLNVFVKYTMIAIVVIGAIFMLIAYFTYYYASKFIGQLLVVAENQKPFDNTGNYNIGLPSLLGLLPNVYFKVHKRIVKIINEDI